MDFNGHKPIYLQIYDHVCERILSGEFRSGDRVMSVRELGVDLGVNPNTVQKAYHLLEEEGIIESRSGARSFVTADDALKTRLRAELLEQDAAAWVSAMKQMGLTRGEALRLTETLWDRSEEA